MTTGIRVDSPHLKAARTLDGRPKFRPSQPFYAEGVMSSSLSPHQLQFLLLAAAPPALIDVRKPPARLESGQIIAGSVQNLPDQVDQWGPKVTGAAVVYCVHGHEVSQGVCTALRAIGVDAAYLEGGIEGWRLAGLPVIPLSEAE